MSPPSSPSQTTKINGIFRALEAAFPGSMSSYCQREVKNQTMSTETQLSLSSVSLLISFNRFVKK